MALTTLAYISEARPGLGLRELKQILRRSREHNHRRGVTGYLVFDGTHFAQILEADDSVLDPLMLTIEGDPRHHDLRLLLREPVIERNFGSWCMGCANLAAPVHLDTSELRGLISDVIGQGRLALTDAVDFFQLFVRFRTPEQAALLSL